MTQRRTPADAVPVEQAEQPTDQAETPIALSREEIEEFRAKLRAQFHQP
ncbi:hypothetical protein [Nocardia altamirensis]|nr:hypothetical protein [Nocardia altamirensis]